MGQRWDEAEGIRTQAAASVAARVRAILPFRLPLSLCRARADWRCRDIAEDQRPAYLSAACSCQPGRGAADNGRPAGAQGDVSLGAVIAVMMCEPILFIFIYLCSRKGPLPWWNALGHAWPADSYRLPAARRLRRSQAQAMRAVRNRRALVCAALGRRGGRLRIAAAHQQPSHLCLRCAAFRHCPATGNGA